MRKITFIMNPETGEYLKLIQKVETKNSEERLQCVVLSKENDIMSVTLYAEESNSHKCRELLKTMPKKTTRNPIRKDGALIYEQDIQDVDFRKLLDEFIAVLESQGTL